MQVTKLVDSKEPKGKTGQIIINEKRACKEQSPK